MRVNQPFISFIHHIWGETVLWGTVFIIQTSDNRMQYFTILRYKLLFRKIEARVGFSRKPLKKFSKSSIRPAGSNFYSASSDEWTLTELRSNIIKNLLCLFFILKRFNARHFEYSGKRCLLNDWKQSAHRLKLQERALTINKRNIIRWNIHRDDNFHSGRQVLKCLQKSWVFELKAEVYVLSRLPGVCFFQRRTRGKKIAQTFLLQPEL